MEIPTIDVNALNQLLKKDEVVLIDVREPEEYDLVHIKAAILMPLSTFDVSKLPPLGDKSLVVQCRSGMRSHKACEIITQAQPGLTQAHNLSGGIEAWIQAGLPVEQA